MWFGRKVWLPPWLPHPRSLRRKAWSSPWLPRSRTSLWTPWLGTDQPASLIVSLGLRGKDWERAYQILPKRLSFLGVKTLCVTLSRKRHSLARKESQHLSLPLCYSSIALKSLCRNSFSFWHPRKPYPSSPLGVQTHLSNLQLLSQNFIQGACILQFFRSSNTNQSSNFYTMTDEAKVSGYNALLQFIPKQEDAEGWACWKKEMRDFLILVDLHQYIERSKSFSRSSTCYRCQVSPQARTHARLYSYEDTIRVQQI